MIGCKNLISKSRPGVSTPRPDEDSSSPPRRNSARFRKHSIRILHNWLDDHTGHPYPNEAEKMELEQKTGLKPMQIANWLANARRRRKSEKAKSKSDNTHSSNTPTAAVAIPGAQSCQPWEQLNPLERWKHSPPEHEAASMTDIVSAIENTDTMEQHSASTSTSEGRRKYSSRGSGLSNVSVAQSVTSLETRQTSSQSASNSAVFSHGSSVSCGSFGSFSTGLTRKRERRKARRSVAAVTRPSRVEYHKRIFQCTFCTDTFKSKYDWTRHEKSLHLSLEKWICAPLGPVITDITTSGSRCVYCDASEPTKEHIELHNHRQCEEKGIEARTFFRKDHLRQHMRLVHECELTASMVSLRCPERPPISYP